MTWGPNSRILYPAKIRPKVTKIVFALFINKNSMPLLLKGVVNANLEKMCNKVIFPRTFKTAYFLHLKSISGIFRVLTTLESTILENSLFCWQFDFGFWGLIFIAEISKLYFLKLHWILRPIGYENLILNKNLEKNYFSD